MENEYVHNNPQDPIDERFERLEAQVTDISCNMNLLMVAIARNIGPFKDDGGSNSNIRLGGNQEIGKT